MTQSPPVRNIGYLRSCMDRRFLAETRRAFERIANLGEDKYFHEAIAGGALNNPNPPFSNFPTHHPPDPDGADYVYNHVNGSVTDGATNTLIAMGWQVHLEHCGGLGELKNNEIVAAFKNLIDTGYFQKTYPNMQHIFLVQPYATVIDLNGGWNAPGGIFKPVAISTGSFPSFTVGMAASYINRVDALGTIMDSSTIQVNFSDGPAMYGTPALQTGVLELPNTIRWSDGTTWTKL